MNRTWSHEIRALTPEQQNDGRRCLHCSATPVFHASWSQAVAGRPSMNQQRRLCLLHGGMFADRHGLAGPDRAEGCVIGEPAPLRIMLTGSWPYAARDVLADALYELADKLGGDERGVVLVHGQCDPRRGRTRIAWAGANPYDKSLSGTDWHGHWIAVGAGWRTESHPADWGRHGTAAGPIRNAQMVRLGASVCVSARVRNVPSHGTDDCAAKARRAGVEVVDVWWPR